jgi:glucose/arabinose dehydrogenase/mono/diheme cytochrome c family protein
MPSPFGLRLPLLLSLLSVSVTCFAAPHPVALLHLDQTVLEVSIVTDDFKEPIDLALGPDGYLWCTELQGIVWHIDPATGAREEVLRVPEVFYRRSHGLLSMAHHPHFATEPWVYLHYVYQVPTQGADEIVRSRVVRCRWDGKKLGAPEIILDAIPGLSYHNGSRLVFGPDEKLYVTTGDAGKPMASQDPAALSGKVLRLNPDGTIPADNPTPGSPVWTLGHRNAQGLVFAPNGRVYASEHGPFNDDEVNLLERGRNYGWPVIEGFTDRADEIAAAQGKEFTPPLRAWTPTVAAAGLAYYDHPAIPEWRNTLLLANLKGRALRVLSLNAAGDQIDRERIFLQLRLGRLRDVVVTPAGDVYLLTSNTDWHPRFQPWMYEGLQPGPDHIVRLHPVDATEAARLAATAGVADWREDLTPLPLMSENWTLPPTTEALKAGQALYAVHCAACHGPEGTGAPGLIPPLTNTEWVKAKNRLLQVVLHGLSGRIEVNGQPYQQEMPSFKHLPDDDLAALLTYVRASFGNNSNAVIRNEVVEERKGLKATP